MTSYIAELELFENDPISMLSNSIVRYVEKLLESKLQVYKPNSWITIQIVSDSYLDSTYECDAIKFRYKEKCLIHNQMVYYPGLDEQINAVKSVLEEKLGYQTSTSKYLVELHIANSTDHQVEPSFQIHQDDFGGIDSKVCTGIFYLTNTCESGGELAFYEGCCGKMTKQIKPIANKFVAFKGDQAHCAMGIFNGTRIAVSYQLERIE